MKHRSIAIDGPSGAGKTTIAKMLADELGFILVDTGAMYRAVGLFVCRAGADPSDESAVTGLLEQIDLRVEYDQDRAQHVFLNGEDVSREIRLPEISMYASAVSALRPVRTFLLSPQRTMAANYDVIMDGRDIGTVILPDADVKVFLTASAEVRARRRFEQLKESGQDPVWEDVLNDLIKRDEADSTRDLAPLKPAEDSITVDTSYLDLDQSKEAVMAVVRQKLEQ